MAILSQSSKVFLEKHGLRPISRGAWRAHSLCIANPLRAVPLEDRDIDPRFLAEVQKDPVDQGSARPWPFGHTET